MPELSRKKSMRFPSGPLAGYFQTNEAPAPIPLHLRQRLFNDTRRLIYPFFSNTAFCRGMLDFRFIRAVPTLTIISRRNLGNMPYLLTDLGNDLRAGTVDRHTVNQPTEDAIRALAADPAHFPALPLPVIVEDNSGRYYLILEGNKRFSAVALADPVVLPQPVEALVGHAACTWPEMLAFFNMTPAP
jgi:hypothetical protein